MQLPGVIQLRKGLSCCRSSCVDTPAVCMRKQFQFWNINENKIDIDNVFFSRICHSLPVNPLRDSACKQRGS